LRTVNPLKSAALEIDMYELNDDRIPNYAMKSICHGDVKKSKKETNEAMLGYTFPLMQQTPCFF
jgi:hypothetical protein